MSMPSNATSAHPLRAALATGPVRGLWSTAGSAMAAEHVARLGLDFICVDEQHGFHAEPTPALLRAIDTGGATPLVRVASNEPSLVGRALDAGARGVVVPMVETPADAARAVAACRYQPAGQRSYGPLRLSGVLGTGDPAAVERDVLCLVMIETRGALESLVEIAATPGLDGLFVGPADLALSMGLPLALPDPAAEHTEAVARIRAIAQEASLVAAIHCGDGATARRRIDEGFDLVTLGEDLALLGAAVTRELGHSA